MIGIVNDIMMGYGNNNFNYIKILLFNHLFKVLLVIWKNIVT